MKKYHGIDQKDITITGGFWKNRQQMNAEITSRAVYNRFSDSHRFEALDCNWKDGMNYKPHIFWDSDVAKWIEGAAYIIANNPDPYLTSLCENSIDMILKNQGEDGYFNSYYLITEQRERFKHRHNHELYCAGHLIEAACAYYDATGKDRFLNAMCKFADYIYDVFYVYQTASFVTCGHPEIELALVRLYETTHIEKYLQLARFFLDKRGNNTKDADPSSSFVHPHQYQDHLPLTEQRTAEGHCVRAMYLYSAMADIARYFESDDYLNACRSIFENTVNKKMYITGSIGSCEIGEAFGSDYYLPNEEAYAETCAAISLALFCKRMQQLSADSQFADIIERIIYNGFLSGVSLDGKSFFYVNPLEIDPYFANVNTSTILRRHFPLMQRVELFECSCCPPNVLRFIASIQELMYTYNEDTLFIHQFMESKASIKGSKICQFTTYPSAGSLKITVDGNDFNRLAIRIPGWCISFTTDQPYTMADGYAYFTVTEEINITFDMPVQLYEANAAVQNNAGRVAVARGPIIYCMEEVDNGKHLRSLKLASKPSFTLVESREYQVPVLEAAGYRKKENAALYRLYSSEYEETTLRFIPYFAFANRGINEMLIWCDI